MRTADLVLLVVDSQTGIQEEDAVLARRLQKAEVPVLLVVNKIDTERQEPDTAEFHSLGLGEPIPVSALHGRASGELLDRILDLLPEPAEEEPEVEGEPSFALVGRPNVGKSSLFNRLVGEQRSVVYEQAGTTRDAVDAMVEWPDGRVRFVDTAGLRRQGKMQGVDYYSFVRAARAIDRAHVALLVVDATDGMTSDDKHVAARVIESIRGSDQLEPRVSQIDVSDAHDAVVLLDGDPALLPVGPHGLDRGVENPQADGHVARVLGNAMGAGADDGDYRRHEQPARNRGHRRKFTMLAAPRTQSDGKDRYWAVGLIASSSSANGEGGSASNICACHSGTIASIARNNASPSSCDQ